MRRVVTALLVLLVVSGFALSCSTLGKSNRKMASSNTPTLGPDGPLSLLSDPDSTPFVSLPANFVAKSEDKNCRTQVPQSLRSLFYEHFLYYVKRFGSGMGQAQAHRFAQMLARSVLESSGNSSAVTDMDDGGDAASTQRFYRVDNPHASDSGELKTSLNSLDYMLSLDNVETNKQTNYGILQMSADQLLNPGAPQIMNDTQNLAQQDPGELVRRCGSAWLYSNSSAALKSALSDIATCTAGRLSDSQIQCYAKWAMLCPNFNLSIAFTTEDSYFATKDAAPQCEDEFDALLPN